MPCDDDRIKGVPMDGTLAHAEGYRRNQNPFLTEHMRAKWRAQHMTAEANENVETGNVGPTLA